MSRVFPGGLQDMDGCMGEEDEKGGELLGVKFMTFFPEFFAAWIAQRVKYLAVEPDIESSIPLQCLLGVEASGVALAKWHSIPRAHTSPGRREG